MGVMAKGSHWVDVPVLTELHSVGSTKSLLGGSVICQCVQVREQLKLEVCVLIKVNKKVIQLLFIFSLTNLIDQKLSL